MRLRPGDPSKSVLCLWFPSLLHSSSSTLLFLQACWEKEAGDCGGQVKTFKSLWQPLRIRAAILIVPGNPNLLAFYLCSPSVPHNIISPCILCSSKLVGKDRWLWRANENIGICLVDFDSQCSIRDCNQGTQTPWCSAGGHISSPSEFCPITLNIASAFCFRLSLLWQR